MCPRDGMKCVFGWKEVNVAFHLIVCSWILKSLIRSRNTYWSYVHIFSERNSLLYLYWFWFFFLNLVWGKFNFLINIVRVIETLEKYISNNIVGLQARNQVTHLYRVRWELLIRNLKGVWLGRGGCRNSMD